MDMNESKKRIDELVQTLNYHAHLYYVEDTNEISDYEYDMLQRELLAGNLVRNHGLAIAPGFGLDDVLWLVFVGLCEETVFRGWLLNALWTRADLEGPSLPWKPVALTSVLFLLIHFPIWQRTGALLTNLTGGAFLSILVLSAVFSWTLWKTRTLTVPILLHTAWDLLVTLLA